MEKWPLLNRVRQQLQTELGDNVYQATWKRGAALNLADITHAFLNGFPDSFARLLDAPIDASSKSPDALTTRELEVLRLLEAGLSNRAVAEQLVLSLGTVKWYVNDIYSKLGVSSRTQAIRRARESNLFS